MKSITTKCLILFIHKARFSTPVLEQEIKLSWRDSLCLSLDLSINIYITKIVLTALCGDFFPKRCWKIKATFTTFISYFSPQSLCTFVYFWFLLVKFLKTNYKKKINKIKLIKQKIKKNTTKFQELKQSDKMFLFVCSHRWRMFLCRIGSRRLFS